MPKYTTPGTDLPADEMTMRNPIDMHERCKISSGERLPMRSEKYAETTAMIAAVT
jgi:hypothetical protein